MLVLAAALAPLAGCAAFFAQPRNVEETRAEVAEIRKEQAVMLALLRELEARADDQSESMAALRADAHQGIRELSERIEVLMSRLEDQGVQFERLRTRIPDTPVRESSGVPPVGTPADSLEEPGDAADPSREPTGATVNQIYDAAYRDFSRGNYDLAIDGFQELLRLHPDTDLSDNAQYWMGECYYGLGDLDRAVMEYLKVRDLYPDGDKVAAATLKTGYAFLRKGDSGTARRYFQTVLREFPDSDEARLADDKLRSMQ